MVLEVFAQLIIAIATGVVSFFVTKRINILIDNKKLMDECLNKVCLPLHTIIKPSNDLSFNELHNTIVTIKRVYNKNFLLVPSAHIKKLDVILSYIELYNKANLTKKKALEKSSRKKYKNFRFLFLNYLNSIKKKLGYPYSSTFMDICYSHNRPYIFFLLVGLFYIVILSIYAILIDLHHDLAAIIFMIAISIAIIMLCEISYLIEKYGGLNVILVTSRKKIIALLIIIIMLLVIIV